MAYLPSLPDGAVLLDVFRAYPQAARPLPHYHQALLRGPSPARRRRPNLVRPSNRRYRAWRADRWPRSTTWS